jgi:hypothetical protein
MTAVRHCQHCWGNCKGECLLDDTGLCVHRVGPLRAPWRLRLRLLLSGRRRHSREHGRESRGPV